ncbi:TRAP transporter large permease [Virgibacillus kimchii]
MSSEMIGWIGIIVMLILLFARVHVAFVLAFVGFLGYWYINDLNSALSIMGDTLYSVINNYNFSVVPLFLLMGYFAFYSGIVSQLFNSSKKWVGHFPGGLAQATVVGGAGFGAASGSGFASTATLARITIPEMIKSGVDPKLAYGVVASVGPLAQMIPPSIMMIMFAIIAEQPISSLLIGGIFPGLLAAGIYMLVIIILVKRKPSLAPVMKKASIKERFVSLKNIWGFVLLALIIIVGIYSGIFTATEAGAIGALAALILTLVTKRFNTSVLKDSILQTIKTSSMVFLIVGSAFIFGYFLGITRIPVNLSEFLVSLDVPRIYILIGIIIMYLILGMFMDMLAAMFLTLPIILPSVIALGYDPIWFGVLLVFIAEVSLVTPPFGLSLFIIKGSVPNADISDVIRGSIPFILGGFLVIILLIIFPEIVTFLPSMMN